MSGMYKVVSEVGGGRQKGLGSGLYHLLGLFVLAMSPTSVQP